MVPSGVCCSQMAPFLWLIVTIIECKDLMPVVDSSPLLEVMARMKINFEIFKMFPIFIITLPLHHHFIPSSSLLLVTDSYNKRLSIWSGDGHQHITNTQINDPRGVCVDLNGFVNVSCNSPDVVCIYDPRKSYEFLQTLGGYGSAPGQFKYPTGMCVVDLNTLMVVEYYNHRVQFF